MSASRKRGSDQADSYVPNENSEEGWAGPPGSSRVRLVESSSTHFLETERRRSNTVNKNMNDMLESLRQSLGPEAQSLTLPEILNAMLLERQKLHEDADSLREQFARHSEDAQARMDKLREDLAQAREDSRLTRADAAEAREEATKATEASAKAREDTRLAQEEARKAQTESEALEASLRQQVRRNKEDRLRFNATASPSATPQTASDSSQPPTPSNPANPQPPPATPQNAPASFQPPTPNPDKSRPPRATPQNAPASSPPPPPPHSGNPRPPPATTTTPKEGSRLYHNNLKKKALNSLPAEQKRSWNALFRRCFKQLTGRSRINDFNDYNSTSDATAEAFGDGTGPGPQGDDLYRLYFGFGWRQAAWNREVVANIAKRVLNEVQGDTQPCLSAAEVEAAVWDLVRQAQVSWKVNKPRPVVGANGEERMEDGSEAAARQNQYALHREQRLKINGRKKTKYEGRKIGIVELREAPSQQDPVAKRKWEMMEEVNEALGTEGQSSEESDREPGKRLSNHAYPLKVTRPSYRHELAGELMENLDKAIDQVRADSGTRRVRHRVRTRSTVRSTNSLQSGLPTALYDPYFLEHLTPTMRNRVRPRDTPMPRFSAYVSQTSDRMQE